VIDAFKVIKGAPSPSLSDMMNDDEESPLLTNQKMFMLLNSLLMYGAMRTYPEIRPAVTRLSLKYNKANEMDIIKARSLAEFIFGCRVKHKLILVPKSMKLMSSVDAAYAIHAFESDSSCYFMYVSSKQPVIAKSAGEPKLIAENKTGDYVEWSRELVEELGYPQGCVPMHVDSTYAMQMIKQDTGSIKRATHIKISFFYERFNRLRTSRIGMDVD
jgi:hypothetical protein